MVCKYNNNDQIWDGEPRALCELEGTISDAKGKDCASNIGTGVKRSLTLDIEETPISNSVGKSIHVVKTVFETLLFPKNEEVRWVLNWQARLVNGRNLRGGIVISSLVRDSAASVGNRSRSSPFLTKR